MPQYFHMERQQSIRKLLSNFRLTDSASKGHGLGDALMKNDNPLRVFTTDEGYLKPPTLSFLSLHQTCWFSGH